VKAPASVPASVPAPGMARARRHENDGRGHEREGHEPLHGARL